MHIAIVDDDVDILDWFRHILEKEGHELDTAQNGQEGLDMILTTKRTCP